MGNLEGGVLKFFGWAMYIEGAIISQNSKQTIELN